LLSCSTTYKRITDSQIQSLLLDIGANIATPRKSSDADARLRTRATKMSESEHVLIGLMLHIHDTTERTDFPKTHVAILEQWIDELDAQLPSLRNFILPVLLSFHTCKTTFIVLAIFIFRLSYFGLVISLGA